MNEKDKMIGYLTFASEISKMFGEFNMSIKKVELDDKKTTFVLETDVHNYEFLDIDSNLEDKVYADNGHGVIQFEISLCDNGCVELNLHLHDKEGYDFTGVMTEFSRYCWKTKKSKGHQGNLYDAINLDVAVHSDDYLLSEKWSEVYNGHYGEAVNNTIKVKNTIYRLMKDVFKKYYDLLVEFYKDEE